MSSDDKMSIEERRKYLRRMKKRYTQATRKERGQLLDEMEVVTELHRKSLIRLMNGSLERKPRRKQRGCTYRSNVDDALRVIAESLDYVCAERLNGQATLGSDPSRPTTPTSQRARARQSSDQGHPYETHPLG